MKLEYLDLTEVKALATVYNEQISDIPHCHPVSPEEFEKGFRFRKYADEPRTELYLEKLIVGEQNGKITGFADVALANTEKDRQNKQEGMIRFLTYQPGYRAVGQAILDESEKYLRGLGMKRISAFRSSYHDDYCYRFYHLGFGLVSDLKGHICALFRMNGYKVEGGEIFMDQPGYRVDEPVIPDNGVEIVVEQKTERDVMPRLTVQALRDGEEFGVCESVSVSGYCQAREAQDWIFIKWLGVEDAEQRKGWGRYLLQRNLWEAQKIGYKNTAISTNMKNHRAHLFYTNYGYQMTDTAYQFVKEYQ